jgi:hypothetical protein
VRTHGLNPEPSATTDAQHRSEPSARTQAHNRSEPSARDWFATHRCPSCGSDNVRRSTVREYESGAHAFRSPYRCRECHHRFWVISRRARAGAAAAGAAIAGAVALVVFIVRVLPPAWAAPPLVNGPVVDHVIEEWSPAPPAAAAPNTSAPNTSAPNTSAPAVGGRSSIVQ